MCPIVGPSNNNQQFIWLADKERLRRANRSGIRGIGCGFCLTEADSWRVIQIVSLITVSSPDGRRAMLRVLNVLILVALLAGCASSKFVFVESENFDERVKHIVIHYASENLRTV